MKYIAFFFLAVASNFSAASCDFSEVIPRSWVVMLDIEALPEHIADWNRYSCQVVADYQKDTNNPTSEVVNCSDIDGPIHPILREAQEGDMVGVFGSPEECTLDETAPIYAGYVLYRDGRQVAFELKLGSHNQALKWDTEKRAP